ncbi:MAG: ATP-binding cassette domain-containing protein [Bacteroidetes bacterium]|nr:ATP-binding cassette domain-containing protein [Bacteroidota bacterium]
MSESLLKAILDLFILVIKEDDITESERDKVVEFLNQHLSQKNVQMYLEYFDKIAAEVIVRDVKDTKELQELLMLCKKINVELTKKQKTVLLKELIELILADGIITQKEDDLVKAIAKAIHTDEQEVEEFKIFIAGRSPDDMKGKKFIVLTDKSETLSGDVKFQIREGLDSDCICFIHVESSDSYFLKYLGSAELLLNNIILISGQIKVFPAGSAIRGRRMEPVYYSDIVSVFLKHTTENPISFKASDIFFKFPNGNLGLRDINISEKSGRLVGLMGASGAGKSTLLNVLNGTEKPTQGIVRINSIDIHREKEKTKGIIGFVPQDDLLIEDLTVYQNLYYAGKLCFKNLSEDDLDKLVNKTLLNLGLTETKNLKVGSPLEKTISGGQRKRLNIGLELLREPGVLFVDEPTSGLSSRDSENIMDLLKELSFKGKLVFVVIHQPSSDIFKMFDKLIILDVGGYQIFYGNPVESVVYFKELINLINKEESQCELCGNVNPEQIFNIIETRVVDEYGRITKERKIPPEQWHQKFEERKQLEKIEVVDEKPPSSLDIPGKIIQFIVFLKRDFLSKVSNRQYMIINLTEAPLLAFLLAFIVRYYSGDTVISAAYMFSKNENIPSYIFMSIIVALFMGLTVSAEEIFKDRKILKREQFLNLSKGSYLMSKVVLLLILTAIQTLLFVLVGNSILEIKGMFLPYWAILFSCSFFANMMGLNISSAFNSAVTIYILIPILLIPQLLLSGVVVKFDKLNPWLSNEAVVPLVGDLMASRWAMEATMVAQFKDNEFEKIFYNTDKKISDARYKKLYFLPKLYSKLDYCFNHLDKTDTGDNNIMAYNMGVLRNEIKKELKIIGENKFPDVDKLYPETFNADIFKSTKKFLDALKTYYNSKYNQAVAEKDAILRKITGNPEMKKQFERLRETYSNESVSNIVRNITEQNRIVERDGRLIRKLSPVYMTPVDPANMLDFRTQFYVAEKYFAGKFFPTPVFNIVFIWLMSIILYATLYFDILRKIVNWKRN